MNPDQPFLVPPASRAGTRWKASYAFCPSLAHQSKSRKTVLGQLSGPVGRFACTLRRDQRIGVRIGRPVGDELRASAAWVLACIIWAMKRCDQYWLGEPFEPPWRLAVEERLAELRSRPAGRSSSAHRSRPFQANSKST